MSVVLRVLTVIVILTVGAVCISLGRWQLGRWEEKKQANAVLEQQIAAEPVTVVDASRAAVPAGMVRLRGRFDTAHHVVLGPRGHGGSPGVHIVTPFLLANDGGVVLVNRGWLFAADAHTAFPENYDESQERDLIGIASTIQRGVQGPPWTLRAGDSSSVWSARTLDLDSLGARLPFAVAPWQIQELPGDAVPPKPARLVPEKANEMTHVSYAVQWFMFAAIILVGPLIVLRARRRGAGAPPRRAPEREVPVP